jgi:hypothetical protein
MVVRRKSKLQSISDSTGSNLRYPTVIELKNRRRDLLADQSADDAYEKELLANLTALMEQCQLYRARFADRTASYDEMRVFLRAFNSFTRGQRTLALIREQRRNTPRTVTVDEYLEEAAE